MAPPSAAPVVAESTPRRRIQVPSWFVLALALLGALLALLIGESECTQLASVSAVSMNGLPPLEWFTP